MAKVEKNGLPCLPLKHSARRLIASVLFVGLLGGLATGCAQTSKMGVQPPVERLGALELGRSGKAEVRELLGLPQGEGMSRLPDYPGLRTVWAYDFMEMQGQRVGMTMLFIFFDGEAYDGYLWFDAVETARETS